MTDPVRPIRAMSSDELARSYDDLLRRVLAIMADNRKDVAELRGAVREAINAGDECREQTRAMREEFQATLGCVETLKKSIDAIRRASEEYVAEVEAKLKKHRRETESLTEEAIAEATKKLSNTGRFQVEDVKGAAEEVVRRNELEKIEAEAKRSAEGRRTVIHGILIGVGGAVVIAILVVIWKALMIIEGPQSASPPSVPQPGSAPIHAP